MKAGDEGFVQLRLEEKIVCKKQDPFVIRTYSPMDTIGGGVIIDVSKEKHSINKHIGEVIEELKIKESGDEKSILEVFLKNNSSTYPKISDMMSYVSLSKEKIEEILSQLKANGKIVEINNRIIHIDYFDFLEGKLMRILEKYHKSNPLKIGMLKQEAGTKVDSSFKAKDIDAFLALVVEDDRIKIINNLISLKEFEVKLSDEQKKMKSQLESKLDSMGYNDISTIDDICDGNKAKKEVLDSMIGTEVQLLDDEYIISTKLYEEAKGKMIDFIKKNGEMSLAEFRDMMDSSRKICMIILESFDKQKITKRVENKRVLY